MNPPNLDEFVSDFVATIDPPYTAKSIAETWADQYTPEGSTFDEEVARVLPEIEYYLA